MSQTLSFEDFRQGVLNDYRLLNESRLASVTGRREVLSGRGKFGIFGDGKELAQIAMAKYFNPGDFRAGYYRDQTFMMASGLLTVQQFFAQLYAHADLEADPSSSGRNMTGHYSTVTINGDGSFKNLTELKNSSGDIAPTAGQMSRLVGLAYASKLFRNNPDLHQYKHLSVNGNEVAFGTIGDASTSEGVFWEAINAAAVLQIPMAVSIWDDGYGISVPQKYQNAKENLSEILSGWEMDEVNNKKGIKIFRTKGWDYAHLIETYQEAITFCREKHIPVVIHVTECTQPQGHSTSGSHERYKSKERLEFEKEYDCLTQFKKWILTNNIATNEDLESIENHAKVYVRDAKNAAWQNYQNDANNDLKAIMEISMALAPQSKNAGAIIDLLDQASKLIDPYRKDAVVLAKKVLRLVATEALPERGMLLQWLKMMGDLNYEKYNSFLYDEGPTGAINIKGVAPLYAEDAPMVDGRLIIKENWDVVLARDPRVVTFGEDVGFIGGVNQTLEGMQKKYGELRVSDAGIRENTIMGQGIGLALRGLRPVAEIQYLDYLIYGLQPLTDDVATTRYRTVGRQKCPLIVVTRGHRLEGIFHAGSHLGMMLHALRGMYICVPRDMTRAAGFYNTLLAGDDPGIIVECLNGYRIKEKMPSNLGDYRIELGVPEVLTQGTDITMVTYGSCVRIAEEAVRDLAQVGISVELIDAQTLLPFDKYHLIAKSVQKTNKLIVIDEDVPGGASAYMLERILQEQDVFNYLDAEPKTLAAKAHRTPYGTDGDYFTKPNAESMFDAVYEIMNAYNPSKYPDIY